LTHQPSPNVPFSVHNIIEPEPHMVAVLDWFILEGADHDETQFILETLDTLELGGVSYYYGDPTCEFTKYLAEVAAIPALGSPYDAETLWAMVEPALADLRGTELEIEITDDDGTGTVFVVCRLASDEIESGALDARLAEMVALTTRVRDLVRP